ncbi:hypothetical protein BKA82DRAFT_4169049 [Pisolithus tinctorius]|nr:hypothetical protein BKA82DRAFT_4169049 [Pisolithus tinctorius]
MSSSEIGGYRVVLQRGITGGFAPPTPEALHMLAVSEDSTELTITSQIRPFGTPTLQPAVTTTLAIDDGDVMLLAELKDILSSIPPQYPGAQDCYGRDISIVAIQDSVQAAMGGVPYGSVADNACQPTAEHVAKFNRAARIVMELVDKVEQ